MSLDREITTPAGLILDAGAPESRLQRHLLDRFGNTTAVNGSLVRENFARWFGCSSVTDAAGEPLAVYHGTRSGGFGSFKPHIRAGEQLGFEVHFSASKAFADRYANDPAVGRRGRRPHVYAVHLQMLRPLVAGAVASEGSAEFDLAKKLAGRSLVTIKDGDGRPSCWIQNAIDSSRAQRAQRLIEEAGYDGVVYEAKLGGLMPVMGATYRTVSQASTSYIVFRPEQIKAADNPSGLYDPNSPDMFDVATFDAHQAPCATTLPWEALPPAWKGAPTIYCADGDGMWQVAHHPIDGLEEDWLATKTPTASDRETDVDEPLMISCPAGWYVKSQNVVVGRAEPGRPLADVLAHAERRMQDLEPEMYEFLVSRPKYRIREAQA